MYKYSEAITETTYKTRRDAKTANQTYWLYVK